jgi:FAD/FMN-containing dehydrogenase
LGARDGNIALQFFAEASMRIQRRTFLSASLAAAVPVNRSWAATETASVDADIPAVTGAGREILLSSADVRDFRASLRGPVLLRSSQDYDLYRRVFNADIDRRPALIARCSGAADARRAVQFARAHDLLVAVRGGGHSVSGKSTCESGLVIDLSPIRGVFVDPVRRTARVAGGSLLGELDREAQAYGLITPTGTVSHTGVGGLTLGGGIGHLTRLYGLTCDNVSSMEVITADGQMRHASETENSDLFWGLRGGGGNFGVVSSFEFRLHPFDSTVTAGELIYPLDLAAKAFEFASQYNATLPPEAGTSMTLLCLPNGAKFASVNFMHCGAPSAGATLAKPLRDFLRPLNDTIAVTTFMQVQTKGDEAQGHGHRQYTKGGFLPKMQAGVIEAAVAGIQSAKLPLVHGLFFGHLGGGAMGKIRPEATAFPNRDADYMSFMFLQWDDPAHSAPAIAWARQVWKGLEPFSQGFYTNFMPSDEGQRRVDENYGSNLKKLGAVKARYDPTNLFRLNANVLPAAGR